MCAALAVRVKESLTPLSVDSTSSVEDISETMTINNAKFVSGKTLVADVDALLGDLFMQISEQGAAIAASALRLKRGNVSKCTIDPYEIPVNNGLDSPLEAPVSRAPEMHQSQPQHASGRPQPQPQKVLASPQQQPQESQPQPEPTPVSLQLPPQVQDAGDTDACMRNVNKRDASPEAGASSRDCSPAISDLRKFAHVPPRSRGRPTSSDRRPKQARNGKKPKKK